MILPDLEELLRSLEYAKTMARILDETPASCWRSSDVCSNFSRAAYGLRSGLTSLSEIEYFTCHRVYNVFRDALHQMTREDLGELTEKELVEFLRRRGSLCDDSEAIMDAVAVNEILDIYKLDMDPYERGSQAIVLALERYQPNYSKKPSGDVKEMLEYAIRSLESCLPDLQRHAREGMDDDFKDPELLLGIFYQCGRVNVGAESTPRVYDIGVKNIHSGEFHYFDALLDEQAGLEAFAQFARPHHDHVWIHFAMSSPKYGFEALSRRGRQLGVDVPIPNRRRRFDLHRYILALHGPEFAPRPQRMTALFEMNHLNTEKLLSLEHLDTETIIRPNSYTHLYEAGEFERIKASTIQCVDNLCQVVVRLAEGNLDVSDRGPIDIAHSDDLQSIRKIEEFQEAVPAKLRDGAREAAAETATGSVRLFGRHDKPIVNGNEKSTLTNARYDVVLALLKAGDKGLTKDQLDHKSGHGDARKILQRLSDSDSEWESVISFPGTSGKGYRIF